MISYLEAFILKSLYIDYREWVLEVAEMGERDGVMELMNGWKDGWMEDDGCMSW